jgi:hypothetical protein
MVTNDQILFQEQVRGVDSVVEQSVATRDIDGQRPRGVNAVDAIEPNVVAHKEECTQSMKCM